MTITFHVLKAGQPMATRAWAAPLTAAEAKRELQDINSSWIRGLRAVGSPVLLPPQHVLADGAIYELDLQEQSGGQWYSRQHCHGQLASNASQLRDLGWPAASGLVR